jgi:hypothetical protein
MISSDISPASRRALAFLAALVLLGAFSIGAASASAALPVYEGDMSFPEIHGPSDPEEYSWEIRLDEGQELQQIDEEHAEVYYTEGHHPAFGIDAEPAHDAVGSTVPTSLTVTEGDILTLIVHHRAGNPAAGGSPFVYPISPGEGWEGGFSTVIIQGPKDERELREERERLARERESTAIPSAGCLVPKLKGLTLKRSKERLRNAGCRIGEVRKADDTRATAGKVVRQDPKPGRAMVAGTWVDIRLGR